MKQNEDQRVAAAAEFRRLHDGPELLILGNVWDAASARVLVSLGAKAVATSSAAVACANGLTVDYNALFSQSP